MEIIDKRNKFDIANLLEFNDKEEANAIVNYNQLLEAVNHSDLPLLVILK